MRALYFAYGSNLKLDRLRGRVPAVRIVGSARLPDYRLACDKRGADGSGKANLHPHVGSSVWGAVYAFDAADWPALDACETLYERVAVRVETDHRPLDVQTYRSDALTDDPVLLRWYHRLILEGAREHALPDAYLRALAAMPSRD